MKSKQNRQIIKLFALAGVMFIFAMFVMPPLYDIFCEITGLGGKTSGAERQVQYIVDEKRLVNVDFLAETGPHLAVDFVAAESISVHPGKVYTVYYEIFNKSGRDLRMQAAPSVSPGSAASQLQKIECFCFTEQILAKGASKKMGVTFLVKPGLDKNIKTMTLGYTMFSI